MTRCHADEKHVGRSERAEAVAQLLEIAEAVVERWARADAVKEREQVEEGNEERSGSRPGSPLVTWGPRGV